MDLSASGRRPIAAQQQREHRLEPAALEGDQHGDLGPICTARNGSPSGC
jgi:hypothetical protein